MLPRILALAVLLGASTGCNNSAGGADGGTMGSSNLGTYSVVATTTFNNCGPGALGQQALWQFNIGLSTSPGQIFWNAGVETVPGQLATDGVTFNFTSALPIDMRALDPNVPTGVAPCVIDRSDLAGGRLSSAAGAAGSTFTGTLNYTFAVDTTNPANNCDDLVAGNPPIYMGEVQQVAALPCTFTYNMTGSYTGP